MVKRGGFPGSAAVAALILVLAGGAPGQAAEPTHRVLGANSLGMHCYDADFSVYAIRPPYNEVRAQVLRIGVQPAILGAGRAKLRYRAQADPAGSINTTSGGKTNFWAHVQQLFGVVRPVDVGLRGARMPGASNTPRAFSRFDAGTRSFVVDGIPITQIDDEEGRAPYPLMRIVAKSLAGTTLAALPVVVPVSDEMDCGTCHLTGEEGADDPGITWSIDPNPALQYRKNIILLHDFRNGTTLAAGLPVLCAECHYSAALDFAGTGPGPGQAGQPFLSRAVHGFHAPLIPQDPSGLGTCFNCHPGRNTQCERGAMSSAGIECLGCHGTMYAVGRNTRRPWVHEPKCQSCHTGDALANHLGRIIRRTAYVDGPNIATPLIVANKRFAEQPGKLYRDSVGHGGVACISCHGSPHAEWPSREANDNLAAVSLQGYAGAIVECDTCHGDRLPLTLRGPHGLHNVGGQAWVEGHGGFFEASHASCQTCHGKVGEGTVISKTKADRVFTLGDGGTVRLFKGTAVGCGHCHENQFLRGG